MMTDKQAKKIADFPGPVRIVKGGGNFVLSKHEYAIIFNTEYDGVDKAMSGLSKKHKKELKNEK